MSSKDKSSLLLSRSWTEVATSTVAAAAGGSQDDEFTVMQWNVLADAYATTGPRGFPHVDSACLKWKHRSQLLREEIVLRTPDLIMLEEVDRFEFFESALTPLGFRGIYQPTTNRSPLGIALFYRTSKFELLRSTVLKFAELLKKRSVGQVVIVVELLLRAADRVVYAAVTHLKAKPAFAEIRHQEGVCLLSGLNDFIAHNDASPDKRYHNAARVLCGDFNDSPESPVWKVFEHSTLVNAYAGVEWTTLKKREKVARYAIDYIWFENLTLLATLDPPTESQVPDLLPCMSFPSDHVDLVAKFKL